MLTRSYQQFTFWLRSQFFGHQLDTPLGYLIMSALALGIAYVVSILGLKFSAVLLVGILALPIAGACLFNPVLGISISMVVAVLVGLLSKYAELPWGMTLDALLFLMFFGLLIRQVKDRDLSFAASPISTIILIWVFYNLIQVLNPAAGSRLAWVFTVRSMAGLVLLYFIAAEAFSSLKSIKFIIKFMIFLALISALYGLKQEFIGFSNTEMTWLRADEKRYQLIVQWSRVRVFSFFSDPTHISHEDAKIGGVG
ncbi:MAG: hypothetical protein AAFP19_04400, partial [Bacteroidota bacterium]